VVRKVPSFKDRVGQEVALVTVIEQPTIFTPGSRPLVYALFLKKAKRKEASALDFPK
jgi:hypothetical protein